MTIDKIINAACRVGGVDKAKLLAGNKSRELAAVRRVVVLLARRLTTASYPDIAAALSLRSHSTVVAMHHKVSEADQQVANLVADALEPAKTVTLAGKVIDAAAFYADLERRVREPRPGEVPHV